MTIHYRETTEQFLPDGTAAAVSAPVRKGPIRKGLYRSSGKRVLDSLLVLLTAPFVLPIIAIMALLVARDGGNPFYIQDRIGARGKTYRMWKLRSMVVDAEHKLEAHLASDPAARAEWN